MPIHLLMMDDELISVFPDQAAFEARYQCSCADVYDHMAEVLRQTRALHQAVPRAPEWGGYFAVETKLNTVVGTCAFVAAPDADGQVEIAYFTLPPYEGRGYGTAMAAALRDLAQADPRVRTLIAHTLPEPNASTRILTAIGMQRAGDAIDPDAGPVWRWAYALPDRPGAAGGEG
ncbi:MAG TPA: GNAT family N-acetyltransferase [Herpetosiphonaceae bacterium]